MAKGGEMGKIDEVDSDEIDKAFSNFEDFSNGGSMKLDWEKADVGDSALVIAENKMGVIVKTYGRRFHLRFPDGSDKTYSAEDLKFFFDEEYANGGVIAYANDDYDNKIGVFNSMLEAKKFAKANKWRYDTILFEDEYGDNIIVSKDDTFKDVDSLFSDSFKKGGMMAHGGEIKSTEKLPYKLDKYFIKGAKTIEVPLAQLFPLRARETGIENAEKFMRMAYNGDMERRKPISIYLMSKGKYKIADGNSTFAVAKKNGWKTIYADVIKNPKSQSNGQKSVFTKAKEIRKDGESWQSAIQRAKMMK
jgi:hypothetical protein